MDEWTKRKDFGNELNEMQESRDRIQVMLKLTKARFGDAQRVLEQKDKEIASLRAPLVNAQDKLIPGDEIIWTLWRGS